jgi:hypothetical protein
MDEKTTKLIKEKFDSLPESIKAVITSSNYEEALLEIGKKYQLNVEKLSILEVETTMVMMALIPTANFETELTRELGVDKAVGSQIVKDINEKIFFKIRELLKLMNTPVGEKPVVKEEAEESVKTETENTTADIMKSAGIEILGKKEEPHPIMAQKLSGYTKIEPVKTEHTLENITKNPSTPVAPATPTPPAPSSYPKNEDPYRMKPE